MSEKGALKCSVILIGGSQVGKTNIISRYISDDFSKHYGTTLVAYCDEKNVCLQEEEKSIDFEIWDTSGQTDYINLTQLFYKEANACILVYDITRRASFEELKNF